jgi:GT2 family glycosyltransferase
MSIGSALPVIAVVIPTWNGWDNVNECLETVFKQQYDGELRVIVVDNGSTDQTSEKLATRWPTVVVVRFEENRGFTGACNTGMAKAIEEGADYVMLVNNDTLLGPKMTARLVAAAEGSPKVALLNPLICFVDKPEVVWANGNVLSLFTAVGDGADLGRRRAEVEREGSKRVSAATGCILLARASVARQLGLLADDFFIYYEDADWSLRMRKAGYEILAVSDALAWHKVSSDSKKSVDYSAFAYYYNIRNRLTLMRRHARWYHWLVFGPRFAVWATFKTTALLALGRKSKRLAIVDAIRDFMRASYPSAKYQPRG